MWLNAYANERMLKETQARTRSQQVKSSNKERRRPQLPSFKRNRRRRKGRRMKPFFASTVRKMRSDKLPQAFLLYRVDIQVCVCVSVCERVCERESVCLWVTKFTCFSIWTMHTFSSLLSFPISFYISDSHNTRVQPIACIWLKSKYSSKVYNKRIWLGSYFYWRGVTTHYDL